MNSKARIITYVAALMLLMPVFAANAAEAGGNYTLTRQYGSVFFRVFHQQYLTLVGRFDGYDGKLFLDPEHLENSTLQASVAMSSLNMTDADVSETLVNSSVWFNADLYPEAIFTSTSAEVVGAMEVNFHGNLEFVGITRPWTLNVKFHGGSDGELGGSTVGISGTGIIDRLDFGLDQYRNMAADEVMIEVNVKFNRD